jgi:hypothetical protein
MDITEIGWGGVYWIHLSKDGCQRHTAKNMALKFEVQYNSSFLKNDLVPYSYSFPPLKFQLLYIVISITNAIV